MRILVIRFSSIGDVLQTLSVVGQLKATFPQAQVDWVTRADLSSIAASHAQVENVFSVHKQDGLTGLWRLSRVLRARSYTHVYDVHNNLRSKILTWFVLGPFLYQTWLGQKKFLRRPTQRWKRFFLFRLRINLYPKPFSGQRDQLSPLKAWGVPVELPPVPQLQVDKDAKKSVQDRISFASFVALAPSAAFALKRWPLHHWKKLIALLPEKKFVVLGGPEDRFLKILADENPNQVICLAGELSLLESIAAVAASEALVANDTGLMHVAEQLGVGCVALMGPAPFGFPSRATTKIMELNLSCRPCSKHGQGPCINSVYQKCLEEIYPSGVVQELRRIIK